MKLRQEKIYALTMIFFTLFLINLVSATTSDTTSFTFKQNQEVDLKISCIDINNTYCDEDTLCNITILYPNASILINNQPMTWNQAYYNYTLSASQTSVLGEYSAFVSCIGGTENGFSTFNYQITTTGEVVKTLSSCLFFVILLFILVIAVLIIGLVGQDPTITVLGAMGIIILGVYYLSNGICVYENWITQAISVVCIGVGIYILLKLAYNFLSFPEEEE